MLSLLQKKLFTPEQIVNLDGLVSQDLLDRVAITAMPDLTEKDLTVLEDVISEDALEKLEDHLWPDKKPDSDGNVPNNNSSHAGRKHDLLGTLALAEMLSESSRKKSSVPFRIGDHVRVKYRGQEGTVVDINGNLIMVALADGRTDSYSASQLERAW